MTQVWAHRGASGHAPENTVPAFELAIAHGADGVEFDVQLSSDGVMVVIHDEQLERTTDGTGRVVEHTFAQLQVLDAGAGREGFTGVRIPTLEPLRCSKSHVGALLDSVDSAVELVEQLTT